MKSPVAIAIALSIVSLVPAARAFAAGGPDTANTADTTGAGCQHLDLSFPWDPLDQLSVAGQVVTQLELSQPKEDPQTALASLTPEERQTLYARADHFEALARQSNGTEAGAEFQKAADEIRAAEKADEDQQPHTLLEHLKNIMNIFGNSWRFLVQPGELMAMGSGTAVSFATQGDLSHDIAAHFLQPQNTWTGADYQVGNLMGEGLAVVPWVAVAAIVHDPKMEEASDEMLAGAMTGGIITDALKYAIDQKRPSGGSDGDPSGHTEFTTMLATVIAENYGWKAAIPAYLIAGYVASSRIGGNEHYLSQIAEGAGIGVAVGMASVGADTHKFNVGPGMVNGAPGIVFSKELDAD